MKSQVRERLLIEKNIKYFQFVKAFYAVVYIIPAQPPAGKVASDRQDGHPVSANAARRLIYPANQSRT
ncbi:MAG: hypothetical protein JW829_20060, partial [Pirellulales bacterium]|nr:hypothetical protein [Pirellulales bacterium]